jgi:hypothetical protein
MRCQGCIKFKEVGIRLDAESRVCQEIYELGIGFSIRVINRHNKIAHTQSNANKLLGFWEFPNHKFIFPICYRISLDLETSLDLAPL